MMTGHHQIDRRSQDELARGGREGHTIIGALPSKRGSLLATGAAILAIICPGAALATTKTLPAPTYTAQVSAEGDGSPEAPGSSRSQGSGYGEISDLYPTDLGVGAHYTRQVVDYSTHKVVGQDYFTDARSHTSNDDGGTVIVNADSNQTGAHAYASLTFYFWLSGPATTDPVPISITGAAGAQTDSINGFAQAWSRITVDYEQQPGPSSERFTETFGNAEPSAAIDTVIDVLPNYSQYSGRVILDAAADAGNSGYYIYNAGFPYTGIAEAYIDPIISIADPELAKLYTLEIGLPEDTTPSSPSAVPEPASWALMIVGFGAIGIAMRRQRRVNLSFALNPFKPQPKAF